MAPNARPRIIEQMFKRKIGVFQFRGLDKRRTMAIGMRNEHHTAVSNNPLACPCTAAIMDLIAATAGKGKDGTVAGID